jgi:hypothetical protein
MRILVTIPHFFNPDGDGSYGSVRNEPNPRIQALTNCLAALHHQFGKAQYFSHFSPFSLFYANQCQATSLDIVVCTTKGFHLLEKLSISTQYYEHHITDAEPLLLGFECQGVLADRVGSYDYYCFMEDDLIVRDPYFFTKLDWFNQVAGTENLLQPNRYELAITINDSVQKMYIDGDIDPNFLSQFHPPREQPNFTGYVMGQQLSFQKAGNPHAGCYFLNNEQMTFWKHQPHFLDRDTSFVGSLESAATLGILRTFKLYKPARQNANFLEIQHFGNVMIQNMLAAIGMNTLIGNSENS